MKIDFGCGPNKKEGFIGVDSINFPGVDVVMNVGTDRFPWEDETVEEANCSHFLEHLTGEQRIHFVNELYRVMKKGGKCAIITPHWASNRAYGDLTHQWPPVSEMWYFYLNKDWRAKNAPHNDKYTCDWDASWGYSVHQSLLTRNQEFSTFALAFYKEAAQDLHATIIKNR